MTEKERETLQAILRNLDVFLRATGSLWRTLGRSMRQLDLFVWNVSLAAVCKRDRRAEKGVLEWCKWEIRASGHGTSGFHTGFSQACYWLKWGHVWVEGTQQRKKEKDGFWQSCRMWRIRFRDAHWALRHADLKLRNKIRAEDRDSGLINIYLHSNWTLGVAGGDKHVINTPFLPLRLYLKYFIHYF